MIPTPLEAPMSTTATPDTAPAPRAAAAMRARTATDAGGRRAATGHRFLAPRVAERRSRRLARD